MRSSVTVSFGRLNSAGLLRPPPRATSFCCCQLRAYLSAPPHHDGDTAGSASKALRWNPFSRILEAQEANHIRAHA
jgi:hypothetical protein